MAVDGQRRNINGVQAGAGHAANHFANTRMATSDAAHARELGLQPLSGFDGYFRNITDACFRHVLSDPEVRRVQVRR